LDDGNGFVIVHRSTMIPINPFPLDLLICRSR
jgi:hypothetical protein